MVLVRLHLCHSVGINCLLCGHLWGCIVEYMDELDKLELKSVEQAEGKEL